MVQSPLWTSAARFLTTNTTTHDSKPRYASVRRILISISSLRLRSSGCRPGWTVEGDRLHVSCYKDLEISLGIQNSQLPKLNQFRQRQILETMLLRLLNELGRHVLYFGADDVV